MESPRELIASVDPAEGRIEGRDPDGTLVGYIDYVEIDEGWEFVHTELAEEFRGKGVGPVLSLAAFDLAREQGRKVRPTCPFNAKVASKHPEVQDLLI